MADTGKEQIRVVCVPTEAGTHFAGQSKAPQALLQTGGLASKLDLAGYEVLIHDQLSSNDEFMIAAKWKPAPKVDGVRNEASTVAVMGYVQEYLPLACEDARNFPIILGGDCSITPAVLSGLSSMHPADVKIGLLYIDGDADLTLPADTRADGSSAILDSLTMTHLTGRAGGLESMRAFAKADGSPLINSENIVLFGFDPLQPATEHWVYLLENGFKAFTRPTVQADPAGCAKKAVAWLQARVDVIYVHFDVDVIDSGEFPLANYPHYAGLKVKEATTVLEEVLRSPSVKGLTITEVNPNNDPDGTMVKQIVDCVVGGMKRRSKRDTGKAPVYH